MLCPDDADRSPSRTACQRADFDHGHGNAALNQVECTRQAECTPADDHNVKRAHSLDRSISVGTVTRLTAEFSILQLMRCSGSSAARPEGISWIDGATTGLGRKQPSHQTIGNINFDPSITRKPSFRFRPSSVGPLRAQGGRSKPPRRRSNADGLPSTSVAAQMSAAVNSGRSAGTVLDLRSPCCAGPSGKR